MVGAQCRPMIISSTFIDGRGAVHARRSFFICTVHVNCLRATYMLAGAVDAYGRKHVHGHSNIWQWQRVTAFSYWMRFVHASRRCEQAKNAMYVMSREKAWKEGHGRL